MSSSLSPTASLLRSSRLFSLPRPLPEPLPTLSAVMLRSSDTATQPYPTSAAITTPPASLARGDWGLKRPLPLKSTARTSTPVLRIGALDNYAHITDFASAADHYLTLKKWQELGMPMSTEKANSHQKPVPATFDWHQDSTVPGAQRTADKQLRWGVKSPVYDFLDARSFERYLLRKIRPRRQEFREFVRRRLEDQQEKKHRLPTDASGAPIPEKVEISDASVDLEIQALRKDSLTLQGLLIPFLNLPDLKDLGSTLLHAPQKTHPSAGLSYLRTNARLANEPGRGFTAEKTAVGRVLTPYKKLNGPTNPGGAVLGVSGFAVKTERSHERVKDHYKERPLDFLDIATKGGRKMLVSLDKATVDADGRVIIAVERLDPMPLSGKRADGHQSGATTLHSESRSAGTGGSSSGAVSASSGGYGSSRWNVSEGRKTNRPANRKPETTPHSGLASIYYQ